MCCTRLFLELAIDTTALLSQWAITWEHYLTLSLIAQAKMIGSGSFNATCNTFTPQIKGAARATFRM